MEMMNTSARTRTSDQMTHLLFIAPLEPQNILGCSRTATALACFDAETISATFYVEVEHRN